MYVFHITGRQSTAAEATGKWQIVGAACITRPPVVCPPMTPLEAQYSEVRATDIFSRHILTEGKRMFESGDCDFPDSVMRPFVE